MNSAFQISSRTYARVLQRGDKIQPLNENSISIKYWNCSTMPIYLFSSFHSILFMPTGRPLLIFCFTDHSRFYFSCSIQQSCSIEIIRFVAHNPFIYVNRNFSFQSPQFPLFILTRVFWFAAHDPFYLGLLRFFIWQPTIPNSFYLLRQPGDTFS